ncbi:MAG: hypothetical protein WKF33_00375 [Thermoleophilaceae bacterium]
MVAEEIMGLRCGPARHIFAAWRAAATRQPIPGGVALSSAEAFVIPTFGLPPVGASLDHAQGYVAEITWRMLAKEESDEARTILYLAHPDSDVTSPGADGFVVYRVRPQDELAFRLWEIKKRDGAGSVSASIRNAYTQLDSHAERYLAKLTAQSEVDGDDERLVDLFANLVPAWKRAEVAAGAGVAVAADADGLPERAFTTMHRRFPRLAAAGGVEGCLVGLGSLREFSLHVRKLLWSGLSTATT